MPRKISAHTTEAPNSTSDLLYNVGSTTRRGPIQQLLSIPITAQGDMLFGDSSADTTRLAPPTSGAILQYSSGSSAPAWVTITSGGVLIGAAAGTPTFLAAPSSGAVLTYSSASSIPAWSIPTSGAVLVASSVGTPTWRALGTSGQVLQSTGGSPAWVDGNTLAGTITTAGTSGQVLQTTGGAAAWRNESLPTTVSISSGAVLTVSSGGTATWLALGSSGNVLESTAGAVQWRTPAAAAAGSTSGWLLSRATSVALSSGVYLAVGWTEEEFDTDAFHSTVTNSTAVTITVAGTYLIGVQWDLQTTASDLIGARIMENNSTYLAITAYAAGGDDPKVTCQTIRRYATTGDLITPLVTARTANVIRGSTGAVQLTKFWGWRLGP